MPILDARYWMLDARKDENRESRNEDAWYAVVEIRQISVRFLKISLVIYAPKPSFLARKGGNVTKV